MDDGNSPLWGFIVLGLIIVINGIFHAFGSALDHIRESDIDKRLEQGDKKARKILYLMETPSRFHDSMQTVATLLGLIGGYIGIAVIISYLYNSYLDIWKQLNVSEVVILTALVVVISIVTVILLMAFGYLVPRKLAKQHPDKTLFRYFGIISIVMTCFKPILWIGRMIANLVVLLLGMDPNGKDDEVTEEEIISMVDEAHELGVLQENEAEMIQNIFEFTETMARDIMTHRKNIIALDGNMFLEDAMKVMLKESNSRYPVYEGDIDNIIGVIHLKDAMKQMTFEEMGPIAICDIPNLIRQVEFVPETRSIDRVFQYMQIGRAHV